MIMERLIKIFVIWLLFLVSAVGIGLLMAFPIMWCWNYAVVSVWGLPTITWGKAWCFNFLAHVLIRSFSAIK